MSTPAAGSDHFAETSFWAAVAHPVPGLNYLSLSYDTVAKETAKDPTTQTYHHSIGGHCWESIIDLTAPQKGDVKTAAKITEFIQAVLSFIAEMFEDLKSTVDFEALQKFRLKT